MNFVREQTDELDRVEMIPTMTWQAEVRPPVVEAHLRSGHAIQQRRSMLHKDRNLSRKSLRREALRSSVNVWEQNEERTN